MASVCARARGCVFEAKRHTPSLSLALLPQRSCGGPAAAEGGVDVGAAAEKAGAEARVRRLQPQPRVRRRRAGGGGGLKCGRRATAERRARSARASFLLPHKVSQSRVFTPCVVSTHGLRPCTGLVRARFAVRARPELGVASEAKTPGSAVTNREPLHGLRHCTVSKPNLVGVVVKITKVWVGGGRRLEGEAWRTEKQAWPAGGEVCQPEEEGW